MHHFDLYNARQYSSIISKINQPNSTDQLFRVFQFLFLLGFWKTQAAGGKSLKSLPKPVNMGWNPQEFAIHNKKSVVTLPETNELPLKINASKINFLLSFGLLSQASCYF